MKSKSTNWAQQNILEKNKRELFSRLQIVSSEKHSLSFQSGPSSDPSPDSWATRRSSSRSLTAKTSKAFCCSEQKQIWDKLFYPQSWLLSTKKK